MLLLRDGNLRMLIEKYLITYLDVELADGIGMDQFETVAGACAAESSTGTWTKVYSGKDFWSKRWLRKMAARAYDLDPETKDFQDCV